MTLRWPFMMRRTHEREMNALMGDLGIAGVRIKSKDGRIRYLGRLVDEAQKRTRARIHGGRCPHSKVRPKRSYREVSHVA